MQELHLLLAGLGYPMWNSVAHHPSLGPTSERPLAQVAGRRGWNTMCCGWETPQQFCDLCLVATASKP